MKRPLDVDEDDGESGSDSESEMESVTGSAITLHSCTKASYDQGRSIKSKERNRMHSKLTRLRRVSRVNQMKERLLELQTEVYMT